MRDTYVLILFLFFLASGTFLAWSGKVEPQLMLTPIITGFLGLLASTKPSPSSSLGPYGVPTLAQRLFSKPPPSEMTSVLRKETETKENKE